MSNCPYVNEEKSGPSNGWYCSKVSEYVDSSLYRNYCNGSVSCQYCPHLGGDDRFRKKNDSSDSGTESASSSSSGSSGRDDRSSGSSSSSSSAPSGSRPASSSTSSKGGASSSSGSGGSSSGFDIFSRIGDSIIKWLMIGLAVVIAIVLIFYGLRYLGAQLGFVKSAVRITVPVAEGNPVQAGDISIVYISKNGTGKEVKASFNAEGICETKLKKGDYVVYEKYDGMSVAYTSFSVNGLDVYSAEFHTDLLNRYVYRFTFCDADGNDYFPKTVKVVDSKGNYWDTVELEEGVFICPMMDLSGGGTLYVDADSHGQVAVPLRTDERIMNCKIMLR